MAIGAQQEHRWKRALGWGIYDIAASGYFLVFPLYLFPVFLSQKVFPGDSRFELLWGLSQAAAVLIAVGVGLLMGRSMDSKGIRNVAPVCLIASGCVSILMPLAIAFEASKFILLGSYVVVHATYLVSLTVYDASLTRIAITSEDRATVSGWAWGWGYLGGLSCMALMEVGILFYPRFSGWDFGAGALFFCVGSFFAASWLRKTLEEQGTPDATAKVFASERRRAPVPWRLLICMLLIVDGIAVFMGYTGIYGIKVLGLEERQMTFMLALLQVLAFPLTGIVSTLGARNVPKALFFCGVGWIVTVTLLLTSGGYFGMLSTIIVVSGVVGSSQALLRSLYADRITNQQEIEGFGRYAVVEKGAAFLGPILAGLAIPLVGYNVVLSLAGIAILVGTFFIWRNAKSQ